METRIVMLYYAETLPLVDDTIVLGVLVFRSRFSYQARAQNLSTSNKLLLLCSSGCFTRILFLNGTKSPELGANLVNANGAILTKRNFP